MTNPIKSPEDVAQEFGLTYCPERMYHTKRVRNLKRGPVERFWFRYNHDLSFQRFIDLGLLVFATGATTIVAITITILFLGA
jgi:hypothetical protein